MQSGPVHLTPAELSLYNGTDPSLPIYLAVNGSIFDVSANPMIYGPGGSYNFFAGRDASRAFVTGCFKEDLTTDMSGVEEMFLPIEDVEDEQITMAERTLRHERELIHAREVIEKTIVGWQKFFRNHKRYFQAGVVEDDGALDPEKGKRVLCEAAKSKRPKRSEMAEEE
jgi:predicted heme/steroid binding protein